MKQRNFSPRVLAVMGGLLLEVCMMGWSVAVVPSSEGMHDWLEGRLTPEHETKFFVPKNVFHLVGFGLSSQSAVLREIAEAGSWIKKGQRLAVFDFPEETLLSAIRLKNEIAQAERDRDIIKLRGRLRELESQLKMARQEEKKARLEIKKKDVLSRRDFQLVELAARQATFEVEAIRKLTQAHHDVLEATRAHHQEQIRQDRGVLNQLDQLLERFRLVAPHDGKVIPPSSAGNPQRHIPGERLVSGMHFLSLIPDDQLKVQFWVPESKLGKLGKAKKVRIESLIADGKSAWAQDMRIVWDLPELSAGSLEESEKVFLVQASLSENSRGFSPGEKVRVGFFAQSSEPASQAKKPTEETFAVERGDLCTDLGWTGKLDSQEHLGLYAPELPNINRLRIESVIDNGSRVEKGQVLVVFESAELEEQMRLTEDQLALQQARKKKIEKELIEKRIELELQVSRSELKCERAKLLSLSGVGLEPALKIEQAELEKESAELQLKLAREELESFEQSVETVLAVEKLQLESLQQTSNLIRQAPPQLVITAPRTGVVFKVKGHGRLEAGQEVGAGEQILEWVNPGSLMAVFSIGLQEVSLWKTEDTAMLAVVAFPELTQRTKCANFKAMESGRDLGEKIRMAVPIELTDPRLGPGLTIRAEVKITLGQEVLKIPVKALAKREGKFWVQTGDPQKKVWREVIPGEQAKEFVEIRNGLKEGERVFLVP